METAGMATAFRIRQAGWEMEHFPQVHRVQSGWWCGLLRRELPMSGALRTRMSYVFWGGWGWGGWGGSSLPLILDSIPEILVWYWMWWQIGAPSYRRLFRIFDMIGDGIQHGEEEVCSYHSYLFADYDNNMFCFYQSSQIMIHHDPSILTQKKESKRWKHNWSLTFSGT